MKRVISLVLMLVIALSATAAWSYYKLAGSGEAMADAAGKFLGTLSPDQRAKAELAYDVPQRTDWHFIPKPTRKGVQIREMTPDQRTAALALLKTTLSEVGYGKATKIMELENLLKELEKNKVGGNIRDPERYFFTVFGKPTAEGKWGLSIEGHHLSLNFVVDKGHVVSSTPTVFATNPAVVMDDYHPAAKKGTRVLAKEETLAFDLLASLTADQRKVAIIAEKAPEEVRNAGQPQPPTDAPVGLAANKLRDKQQAILRALIDEYAGCLPADVAKERLEAIEKAGIGEVHFAWAGADKPGIGHYYRLQGPTFLIEFVNVQPDAAGNPANHIHSIWRDMAGDFAIAIK
ncbi:MAG: DUF3500 domain-containing protein [Pirellulaceae bacterium]|nr:DUF3500 domain-containing protein [Pirellulaceae bacterium]